jgi:hypothetical protein
LDADGNTQVMNFSRATNKVLFVLVTVVLNPLLQYAGDAAVQTAIATALATDQTKPGVEIIALVLKAAALVPGVLDVTNLQFDFVPSPTNTANITPNYDEVVTLTTADVFVTS